MKWLVIIPVVLAAVSEPYALGGVVICAVIVVGGLWLLTLGSGGKF